MRATTRNSSKKLLLEGNKSPFKDESAKIYWFPSLAHNFGGFRENFDYRGTIKKNTRNFLQKHWTFSKKRGRFSEKRWTFSKKSPTFFLLSPTFFLLKLWWNNPLVWRLWKQKVQNPCNVRAWNAHARRLVGKGSRFSSVVSYDCYERIIRYFLKSWDSKWA